MNWRDAPVGLPFGWTTHQRKLKPAIAVMRGIVAGWQGKFGRSAFY